MKSIKYLLILGTIACTMTISAQDLPSDQTMQNMEEESFSGRSSRVGVQSREIITPVDPTEPGVTPIGEGLLILSALGMAYGWKKRSGRVQG